ncbi:MAG: histidine--tRNA ligase, partial [Angelakisella sp.]
QSGRFREFNQFGVELYGANAPAADAEIIALATEAYATLGVRDIIVELNSIGCPTCRAEYHKALRAYFEGRKGELCDTCLTRLEKNPLRILDCKNPDCGEIAAGAPKMLDYLCEDCTAHFGQVKALLGESGIPYTVNPTIVRGLDYYTRTVFEFVYTDKAGKRSVCGGGGRYGGLLRELGGPDYEGIGFAMGLERLLKVMDEQGCDFPPENTCDVYLVSMGAAAEVKAFRLANLLRSDGFFAQSDLMGRSLKAQMKYANKIGAKYTIVLGDNELAANKATLKSMHSGTTSEIPLDDKFSDAIYEEIMQTAYADLEEAAKEL